ncbi:NAD-dependent epimerase/dehydratase family protein [Ancylomarina salipaludis]|uniref:NAD-dependent epimerase/dehydratase family protein n=1 Tax=Ancylomarina salipaludis TaxID=2501299 RepID=A0A4Q1JLL7_9BACT|nr:polysaccharide biosynthesis protein [Ancylomarina salipaludis]RXQ93854.1 NAD-dependent epimerase/dehydratase family protein [Ancylomarina salipaludis]
MSINTNIDSFINTHVTGREVSLLSEDFTKYSSELSSRIDGKKVLVIGGAGTIGSSYIKAILKFNISKLVVVDINENGLTELVRDLRSSTEYNIPEDFITYPINFGDRVFEKLFRNLAPFDIVANFAAHKHVRSEKDIFSVEAMIENNVLKARKLLDLLIEFPPEHFFCVSTDKAANPVNIMGASKKLMEELIMAYSSQIPIKTARFANVAFSNGSLPLGFLDRLNKRQPWSCPLGIRRFFVSPQESGELCLMASIMGESGDIFFPKLDDVKDMIPFDRIAKDLLAHLGMEADICETEDEAKRKAELLNADFKKYPIYFFGSDTCGEKSFEEFYTEKEVLDLDSFVELGVIKNSVKRDLKEIDSIFDNLEQLFSQDNVEKSDIVKVLTKYLPNFEHIETGKHLDQKM